MYKCGWNGCEKAYGTLNHLNAHVTMQSHGQKRTPEGTWLCCRVKLQSFYGGRCRVLRAKPRTILALPIPHLGEPFDLYARARAPKPA